MLHGRKHVFLNSTAKVHVFPYMCKLFGKKNVLQAQIIHICQHRQKKISGASVVGVRRLIMEGCVSGKTADHTWPYSLLQSS